MVHTLCFATDDIINKSRKKSRLFLKKMPGAPCARAGCQKTPGRRRRGRSPFDFHSYPPALPAGRVVDFACKINSLQLRTTSGWPKLLPRKSRFTHFFDTLQPPVQGGLIHNRYHHIVETEICQSSSCVDFLFFFRNTFY